MKQVAERLVQAVGLFYLATVLSAWSDRLYHAGQLTPSKLQLLLVLTAVQLVAFVLYAHWQGLWSQPKRWLSFAGLGMIVAGLFLLMVGNALLRLGLDFFGLGVRTTANQAAIEALFDGYPLVLLLIQGVIVAPVAEEIIFRGVLGHQLCGKSWLGYVVPATLFALAHHPTDIGSFLLYFWPGCCLYLLYRWKNALEIPVAVHMLMNGLAFLVTYLVHTGQLQAPF